MKEVVADTLGTLPIHRLRDLEAGTEAEILTGYGAGINGLRIPIPKGERLDVVDGYQSEKELRATFANTSKGSRLSPWVNRLRRGLWDMGECRYRSPVNFPWQNGHAIHGLVRELPWKPLFAGKRDGAAVLEVEAFLGGGSSGYPFALKLLSTFSLKGTTLIISTSTTNHSTRKVPLAEGWHPYFRTGRSVDQATLHLPPVERLEADDEGIPTGRILTGSELFAAPTLIGERFLDTCYHIATTGLVETRLSDPEAGVEIIVRHQARPADYQFLQLYTPPDRSSIAIEPMTATADAFNHGRDLIWVEPGETRFFHWEVEVVRMVS